jgi:hypothetical protein
MLVLVLVAAVSERVVGQFHESLPAFARAIKMKHCQSNACRALHQSRLCDE